MRTTVRDVMIRVALTGQLVGLLAVASLVVVHHVHDRRSASRELVPYSNALAWLTAERLRHADRALQLLGGRIAGADGERELLEHLRAAADQDGFSHLQLATPAGQVVVDTRLGTEGILAAGARPPGIGLSAPIVRNGQVAYVLHGELDPAALHALLAGMQLPAGWSAAIADAGGRFVARAPQDRPFPVAPPRGEAKPVLARNAGLVHASSQGVAHVTAYARAPAGGWAAMVSSPGAPLYAGLWQTTAAELAAATLLLSAGTWLSLRLSRRFERALEDRQVNTEMEAALGARKLQSVMSMATDAILVSDGQDRVVLANEAAATMFLPERGNLQGAHVGTLLAPETWVQYQTAAGDAAGVPGRGRRAGEPHFPIEYSVTRYTDLRGRIFRTLVVTDVTLREQQQQSLLEARGELNRVNDAFERALLREAENRQAATARELHDAVGSSLAGVSLLLGTAYSYIREPEAAALIAKSQEQVMMTTQQVRQISRGIMPVGQERGALVAALENFAANLSAIPGITCSVRSRGDFEQVSAEIGGHLFRIVQEATNNALRHGHALRVRITVVRAGKWCRLTIRDDGTGCEPGVMQGNAGIGMRSMRARAAAIGGRFSVVASPGRALKVQVSWIGEPA